jgi:integrase
LINDFNKQLDLFYNDPKANERIVNNKLSYLLISMIQLRNGSRISEAINAFVNFLKYGISDITIVKIAKSDSFRYNNSNNKKFVSKPRFRKIMFPITWFTCKRKKIDNLLNSLHSKSHIDFILNKKMRSRVCGYLTRFFNCNTHSLRYAFINYLIYNEKRPLSDVAKFVGHVNLNQLVRYTQQKNCEQIFDLDI